MSQREKSMRRHIMHGIVIAAAGSASAQDHVQSGALPYWPEAGRAAYARRESALLAVPTREHLRTWHELLASEPHVAGSAGDRRTVDRLARAFEAMGLRVEVQEIWPLLAMPVEGRVEIVSPEPVGLSVSEQPLAEDRFVSLPEQMIGWNAYSGSGDVTGEVVYANYGRKEDFAKLHELGVDASGKVALVRYGGNFRGYKAKFAQEAGAAAVLIYTDPADGGYMKGVTYPEGGYANATCIERGSILSLPYPGDPLTPFVEATEHAARLDPGSIDLPRIPVQPIGWGAAGQIVARMTGAAVPEGWQGGLPAAYRLTGGTGLTVRVKVEQTREVTPTFNVIATLRGRSDAEKKVIIGCHHDAWNCGAADPLCGMIALLESARAFASSAARGEFPERSIVFCAWGAEEFGIIGSTEWVEGHRDELTRQGVAYINLDMASMGPEFGASTSPTLRRVVAEAAGAVPQARDPSRSVFQAWVGRGEDPLLPEMPRFGDLGGGSDHIGFWCHALVPSTSLGGGGSKGTSYHSLYDTLPWYWKVVGDDYEPALMVSRMTTATASRLADAPLLPIDPVRYGPETRRQLADLTKRAGVLKMIEGSGREVAPEFARLEGAAVEYERRASRVHAALLRAAGSGGLSEEPLGRANRLLMALDRAWDDPEGLPGRPWFRNLQAANDEDSGYAAWVLPRLRVVVEHGDAAAIPDAVERYLRVFARLTELVDALGRLVE
jgi:N-acetylated-alpha-linked acidic dipeptidase